MKKYILIIRGAYDGVQPSKEEMGQMMQEWKAWYDKMATDGALVDTGNPFGEGKIVDAQGKTMDTEDGWQSSGYLIVQAADLDGAIEIAKGCPSLNNSIMNADERVEVRAIEQMPSM